jgi:hypothetical protein
MFCTSWDFQRNDNANYCTVLNVYYLAGARKAKEIAELKADLKATQSRLNNALDKRALLESKVQDLEAKAEEQNSRGCNGDFLQNVCGLKYACF